MKFRFHRGGLAESMETVVEVRDWNGLVALMQGQPWGDHFDPRTLMVEPYKFDERIGWDAHIVTDSHGVIGFTDGPCQPLQGKEQP